MKFKIFILLLVFTLVLSKVNAQQDSHFTQYMYNTMTINPAYSGTNEHKIINLLGRAQWVGVDGSPSTQTVSYDTPLGYSGMGLGVNLTNDQIGPAHEIALDINTSYIIRASEKGKISFGLKLGGRHLAVDWNKGLVKDVQDKKLTGNISRFLPTIGAGIYYYTNKLYLGVSTPNMLKARYYDDSIASGGNVAAERMHFFLIGGYVFDLSENLKFKPAFLTKVVSGAPLSLDVSANFLFNKKFTLGASWRWDDSISALLGFKATKNLELGFAYDLTTSNYSNYNSGTYELMIRWNFFKELTAKSPRFF
ncbi:type IX secretion system membrane protein PorP/SprF [Aquimarina aquimarini]|uniref:PorP/SprF family type IX secretion system membrane protein n=1 Tax=Aquimarina aquimarini TaxID=1191734 RepID=UPI000D5600AB|nr:type IX secretion system membrane protein PorP/SprF [Aquimarina aquimarini]